VFCEVKTRTSDRFGTAAEAVTPAKQRRLRLLAARYVASVAAPGSRPPAAMRFDVAAVTGGDVEVIDAAF
jgi:putative endonuclease